MTRSHILTENIDEVDGAKCITLTIPANLSHSPRIRKFIGSLIEEDAKISSRWSLRIQLMADELINNAIEHGSTPGYPINIIFKCYKNSDIEIIVEDTGTGPKKIAAQDLMNKIQENKEKLAVDPLSNKTIRGRGLAQIVSNWSNKFTYEDNDKGGLTSRILKHFSEDEFDMEKAKKPPETGKIIQIETITF